MNAEHQQNQPSTRSVGRRTDRPRIAPAVRRPVVAGLAVAAILSGAGGAAAAGWVQVFRSDRVTPVGLDGFDLTSLPDLGAYGDVEVTGLTEPREVDDAAAASAATGLDVSDPSDLPRGITGEPTRQVIGEASATFTFSSVRALAAGATFPTEVPGLDGSRLRLTAGPAVASIWSSSAGTPSLVVARAVAPRASSSTPGVSMETMRDVLLSLSGLPDDLAAEVRAFTSDGGSLPLPFPSDQVTTSQTDVQGSQATVLSTRDGTLAAVVWMTNGIVTVVAGALDVGEVLATAESLQ